MGEGKAVPKLQVKGTPFSLHIPLQALLPRKFCFQFYQKNYVGKWSVDLRRWSLGQFSAFSWVYSCPDSAQVREALQGRGIKDGWAILLGEKWVVSLDEEEELPSFSRTNLVGEGSGKKMQRHFFPMEFHNKLSNLSWSINVSFRCCVKEFFHIQPFLLKNQTFILSIELSSEASSTYILCVSFQGEITLIIQAFCAGKHICVPIL